MVPHHDRSGVVIEPWLTDQWFCDARVLAEPAIAAVENGRYPVCAAAMGEHVFRVDAQHPALVHLAPIVVGPSDPGLVRAGRRGVRRRDRGRGGGRGPSEIWARGRSAPRRGRARHLVFVGAVAVLDLGLARRDPGARPLLSGRRAGHRLRHHLFLGRPDDDDGAALQGRSAVPHRLHPRAGARRARPEDVEIARQHHRSAGIDRPLWRRRIAVHLGGAGRPRPRHQARRSPRRGLSQLRDQAVERGTLCAAERLRAGRRVCAGRGAADRQSLDRRGAGRLRRRGRRVARRLPFRRGGGPALSVCVGHLLRLVHRVFKADPARRGCVGPHARRKR